MSFRSVGRAIAGAALPGLAGLAALLAAFAATAQSYQALLPLLIDLPQWQGETPDGMSMQGQGQDMSWATRAYKRGASELNVMVGIGHPMAAQADAIQQGGKSHYEMGGMVMDTRTVRNFKVMSFHSKQDNTGMVFVVLSPANTKGAMLLVQYSGVEAAEAFALAERFDWVAMQRATKR